MDASTTGFVFKRARRPFLYVKFKDRSGRWVMRATKYRPGQEAAAAEELERLRHPVDMVAGWAEQWLDKRTEQGIKDVANDRQRWRDHIEPIIGDLRLDHVEPKNILAIVDRLKKNDAAPRTLRNVYSVCKAMFRDAAIAGKVKSQPCILTHRQLGKVRDANLGWRAEAVFSRSELQTLVSDTRIPLFRRVLWGILGLGALRDGEACALRWKHLKDAKPLARIVVIASHEGETKTGTERWMPMHPTLDLLLRMWRDGWKLQVGRPYKQEDLVFPTPPSTNKGPRREVGKPLDKNWIWKRLQADLRLLGLRPRRAHDMRRTLISLAIEDGADESILKRGTHAPPKHVMGLYTSVQWKTLCREVSKLNLPLLLTRPGLALDARPDEDEVTPF